MLMDRSRFRRRELLKVLIYGPRKSGSTLLQRMIDGSDLFVLPGETKIKSYPKFPSGDLLDEAMTDDFFRASKRNLKDFKLDTYDRIVRQKSGLIKNIRGYIDLDIEASLGGFGYHIADCKGWCIKEVGGDPDYIISKFLEAYPEGKVIMIFRNPRYVARSVYMKKKSNNKIIDIPKIIREAKAPWQVMARQKKYLEMPNVYRVDYEKLVGDPASTMRSVAGFLEIPFNDVLTHPTMNGQNSIVRSSSRKTDRVFISQTGLREGITLSEFLVIKVIALLYKFRNIWP